MSIGGHESPVNKTDTWLTPPHILRALGEFDLDPCTPPVMPWQTAKRRYTEADDGLLSPWEGRVWCNPPYSKDAVLWMRKLAEHGTGTALIFARTETAWFVETVWGGADAVLFLHGRLCFHDAAGVKAPANAGAPSCLVAYGEFDVMALEFCGLPGTLVRL
jgi:hypothetical protein